MPEKDKKKSIGAYLRSPRKDIFVEKKLAFSILLRLTKMSNYEIFDLLYSDIIEKFDADNRVFTHKYVVGRQQIRIHVLKPDEEIDPVEIPNVLNKLQEKYAYHSGWSPFYFSSYSLK